MTKALPGMTFSKWVFAGAAIAFFLFLTGVIGVLYTQNAALRIGNYDRSAIAVYQLRMHYNLSKLELTRLANGLPGANFDRTALEFDIFYERVESLLTRPPYDELIVGEIRDRYDRLVGTILAADEKFSMLRSSPPASHPELAAAVLAELDGLDRDFGALASRLNQRMSEVCQTSRDQLLLLIRALSALMVALVISSGCLVWVHIRHLRELRKANEDLLKLSSDLATAREAAVRANNAKSQFLAGMSHELRTPLNAILGFSDIIRNNLAEEVGEKSRSYADDIHMSGTHLLTLVNSILDTSRIEQGTIELEEQQFSIGSALDEVTDMMAISFQQAEIELEEDPCSVLLRNTELFADRNALRQMLINLVSNAVKFTEQGGRIGFRLERTPDDGLRLSVWDTGIGIAPKDLPRLGQAFERGRSAAPRAESFSLTPGVGLGLSITKSLAELHGGTLELVSTEGQGTTASILLPPARVRFPKERLAN